MNIAATVAPGAETSAKQKNDKRHAEFKALARKLGEDKAKGEDALPKLAHAIVQAAADGVIDKKTKVKSRYPDKNGAPQMTDHVGEAYEEYMMTMGRKAVHERSPKSIEVQISKLRKFLELGLLENVDGVVVMDAALDAYRKVNDVNKDERSKGAYDFYQAVAKAQCDKEQRNTMLTEDQIEALIWKGEAGEKTLEGELKRAMKILETLIAGEGKDKIKDTDERTEAAFNMLRDRTNELAKLAQIDKLRADALALGITF